MKFFMIGVLLLTLMFVGCGVKKDFVMQQIEQSEARTKAELDAIGDKTDGNADEIAKLKSLAAEIDSKADMAINEAKGFETYQIIWQGEVNFDFDSYAITPTAEGILNEAGAKMEQNPSSLIEIAGYTDKTGSNQYNLMLGEKRAGSAKRYLADKFGISLYRLFIVSYGEDKQVSMDSENQSASKNRRVTLTVWGKL